MKKKSVLLIMLLALSILITSCGSKTESSDETQGTKEEKTNGEDKSESKGTEKAESENNETVSSRDEMIIGCYGEPQSMWPANDGKIPGTHLMVNIYDTLFTLDKDANVLPRLAESYEQVDELTYKIKLREGVKFHDGKEMTADDVLFTFKHATENPVTRVLTDSFDVDGFEKVDDYTVILKTLEPFAPFVKTLCHITLSICSEDFYNENKDTIDAVPNGTGPFKFVEWNEGDNVVLERFDDFWGEPAKLKTLNFRLIPEANSRTLELETGGIDIMYEVPGITLEQIEENKDLILWKTPGVAVSFLGLNFDKELFQNTEIRKAIAHATDADTLRKVVLMDGAVTAKGYLAETVPGAKLDLVPYEYNPELAKEILAEQGYPDGISFPLGFFQSSDNRRMGEVLQAMYKEAGINLELVEMETASWTPFLNSREQWATITTLNNVLRDPHSTLMRLDSEAVGVGGNRVNYANEEMDSLIRGAAREIDWDKRLEMYDDIQTKLNEQVVWIPLYSMNVCTATTNKIRGFEQIFPASYQRYDQCYFVD